MKEIILKKQSFIELLGLPKDYFHTRWVERNGGENPEKEEDERENSYEYYKLNADEINKKVFPTLEEFLLKKKSLVDEKGKNYIFLENNTDLSENIIAILVIDKNGVIEERLYCFEYMLSDSYLKSFSRTTIFKDSETLMEVCFNHEKHMFVFDGDLGEDIEYSESEVQVKEIKKISKKMEKPFFLTISFSCFSNIFRIKESVATISKFMTNNGFTIVDFTSESVIPFSNEDQKFFRENQSNPELLEKKMHKPDRGYSIAFTGNAYQWHRPETLLFRYTTEKEDISVVMGMDEDSYFASVLPNHPRNIKEAFRSLIPESIRKKNIVNRQGEWFIVGAKKPKPEDIAMEFKDVTLPRDSIASSAHYVEVQDEGTGIIDNNNNVLAKNFLLSHSNDEHEEVMIEDNNWYMFVRNTAIRSASSESMVD